MSCIPPTRSFPSDITISCTRKIIIRTLSHMLRNIHNLHALTITQWNVSFEGTWVSYKLHTGIEKGYLVTRIDEIWQYKYTRYNSTTHQNELFADYINSFLQLKQEANERPSECGNDDVLLKSNWK